jgi:hypothetical protein
MANATVSRLGANNQDTDKKELFLKIFAGEIITKFKEKNIMLGKSKVRNIKQGKSASFPVIGGISASYHTPGVEIDGQNVNHSEKVITIDDLLISDAFIADIDEAMNHYEVRSEYSNQMGVKLAKEMDINIFIELLTAARASATLDDSDAVGGTEIVSDDLQNDGGTAGSSTVDEQATALANALFEAAQIFDENDIPEDQRYVAFRPAEYYVLAQNLDLINKDYSGMGAISEGNILKVAGVDVVKSNNVPSTDTSANTGLREFHGINAETTVGTVWNPSAIGTVKLMDLSMQMEWDIRRQGTLMVARYAVGHGVLRPECAIELKLDTLTN